jgi:hypothetical protein
MADLDRVVEVKQSGKTLYTGTPERTIGTMVKTLVGRGDPRLVFDAEIEVTPAETK